MRGKLFLLSLLSGVLLSAAWPPYGFAPLLLVAFVPLLLVQHTVMTDHRLRARHLFVYAYTTFLTWNVLITWWVWNASTGGGILANVCNALLMAFVFLLYHKVRLHLPQRYSAFALVCIWVAFEYLHLDWDLSWPWLTLGNVFADLYKWVQWYEFTGVFGGSALVLLINVMAFELFVFRHTTLRPTRKRLIYGSVMGALIVLPAIYSIIRYHQVSAVTGTEKIKVVVVQPNIDPYNEKFSGNYQQQLDKMLLLAEQLTDSTTDYLVMPETALVEDLWENTISQTYSINKLRAFRRKFPKLKIVTGASTYRKYEQWETPSVTARKFRDADEFYDAYNTALQIDVDSPAVQVYHKSKLVPGVEKMPFPRLLKPLEKYAIDMGGSSGSLGMQDDRTPFVSPDKKLKVAPVICYESIYGEYVGQYLLNGAEFIFIVTNDGWWGDTPGYRQHLIYGRLRSIESRKGIARAANTGISCFIHPNGDISQATGWWVPGVIAETVESIPGQTFYTRHGDYLARIALGLSVLALGLALVRSLRTRFKKA